VDKKNNKILLAFLACFFLQSIAFASQEGVLDLSNFTVKSKGIGSSGPVLITGARNEQNEFVSLKIEAFGKEYNVSPEGLKKIPEGFYNGIQLSYEHGYKELGGRTIYIVLQMGFVSKTDNRALITLSENGDIKIEEIKNSKD